MTTWLQERVMGRPVPVPELPPEPAPRETAFLFQGSLLFLTLGVFIVCCAFALSRASLPGGMTLLFVGEFMVVLTPLVFLYLNRLLSHGAGLWMSLSIGVATYVLTLCYSPTAFAFTDEYQHSFTARSILQSGHLFQFNPTLPVSPHFPGMEIVTTQLCTLSGMSIFAAGSVVAGLSHVLLTGLVFLLGRTLGLSARASAFAVVVFTTGYDYKSFLSYFAYETFAFPFMVATLILFVKMLKTVDRNTSIRYGIAAFLTGCVTIVSHHVTSYFMVALVGILTIAAFLWSERWRHKAALLVFGLAPLVVVLVIWDVSVASDTIHYLSQIRSLLFGGGGTHQILQNPSPGVAAHVSGGRSVQPIIVPLPLRVLGDLGEMVLAIVIPFGAWTIWKDPDKYPRFLWLAPLLATFAYYLLLPIFLLSPSGISLVGRGQVLLLMPAGLVSAVALDRGSSPQRLPWRALSDESIARIRSGSGCAVASVIVMGGVAASYPPYSGKLPAPYNVAAYTRSSDERTIAAGAWMYSELGPQARAVGGRTQLLLLGSIAGVQLVSNATNLLATGSFTHEDAQLVQNLQVGFVIADHRLTTELPAMGFNFSGDPFLGKYVRPLPGSVLAKFDHIPGVSRLYDDGTIVIYCLYGSQYYTDSLKS